MLQTVWARGVFACVTLATELPDETSASRHSVFLFNSHKVAALRKQETQCCHKRSRLSVDQSIHYSLFNLFPKRKKMKSQKLSLLPLDVHCCALPMTLSS